MLLLFHPRFEDSRANRALWERAAEVEGLSRRDMYEIYPDFNVDVEAEKEWLRQHDIVVWQHPFYWYSCPPLMKQWLDLVLEFNWAYGPKGEALRGKWAMNVLTSGGTFEVYQADGRNRFTYREFLRPFEQTAQLCGMAYLPPFVVPGASRLSAPAREQYAEQYRQLLQALQTQPVEITSLQSHPYSNDINPASWPVHS
ncbi:MAG: NAD(P)H-dependent oxidoreductase [Microscillaceae bacterium]